MTHKEQLRKIFREAGIVVSEETDGIGHNLVIKAEAGPKNTGYGGFVTVLSFDEDDKLVEVGLWE